MSIKVVAFNGSARKDGNTAILVQTLFKELEKAGIETELVPLAAKKMHGCLACGKCWETKDRTLRYRRLRQRMHCKDGRGGRDHPCVADLFSPM